MRVAATKSRLICSSNKNPNDKPVQDRKESATLIKAVFKDDLYWDDGMFRTNYIDLTFHDNLLKIKNKGLLFNEQPFRKSDKTPISVHDEEYFEHLERFLVLIEPIIEDLSEKRFI